MTALNASGSSVVSSRHEPADGAVLVAVEDVHKSFGGARALVGVSVSFLAGRVHALVGENGAGKSTLGRIIAGVVEHDSGRLIVDGQERRFRGPRMALADGITIIEQELNVLPSHTVLQNVFLGVRGSRRVLERRFEELRDQTEFTLDPDALAGALRVAEQQEVEIMRALARRARLIVMDEPTASLARPDADKLLRVVRRLRDAGTAVIYVSHMLDDVLEVADDVTVLKDGARVRTALAADETSDSLVTAMLGHELDLAFPERRPVPADAPIRLEARNVSRPGVLDDVSLEIRRGEIVGIAGLVGSGRSELAHAIYGADHADGKILVDGVEVTVSSPAAAVRAGIALLPESRKDQGLLMGRQVGHNVTVSDLPAVSRGPMLDRSAMRRSVGEAVKRFDVRPARGEAPIAGLSGGNQQKVLLAKCMFPAPKVLIADEPTRGVDIGAKRAIYSLLSALADEGLAILLISSELEEIQGLAHRIIVMRSGRVIAEMPGDVSEPELMAAAFGNTAQQGGS